MSATDVTDGNSEEVAHGGSGEEAAWLELIGRFDAPAGAAGTPVPWPEREELEPPREPGKSAAPGEEARADGEAAGAGDGTRPEVVVHPWASLPPPAGPRTWRPPADAEDEHFIPPPPPPLPSLSPAAKGAWVALFGGPAYLLTATLAGWSVPGWALFAAIAAFVGGFTVLVLRLGDGSDRDSGPGDDGAVL